MEGTIPINLVEYWNNTLAAPDTLTDILNVHVLQPNKTGVVSLLGHYYVLFLTGHKYKEQPSCIQKCNDRYILIF